jgi:hypothetical protein
MAVRRVHVKKERRTTLIVVGVVGQETCGQRDGCAGLFDVSYLCTARWMQYLRYHKDAATSDDSVQHMLHEA